jgi:SSS family solute:Na+ symporter
MSGTAVALDIMVAIVALGSGIGFFAAKRSQPNLEQWAVAGRGLGLLLVWILLAGETFTAFSVLGISGWIYSRGGPTLYVLAYLTLGQCVIFFFAPPLWEHGRRHGLQTIGDFFRKRYESQALAAVVSLAGVVFLVIYLQLQLTSLGIIVEVASSGGVARLPAMVVSTVVVAGFVLTSGIRGIVWVSVLKDFLLVVIAGVVGIGIPYLRFGGIGRMFDALLSSMPGHFTMPGATINYGHSWFITTVLVNSLVLPWPHFFASMYTAKSGDTLRRNAVIMPFYLLPLLLIIFAGSAAILLVPGLKNGDLALLAVVKSTFPPWVLGVIGGAGALTAMVPASVQILTASTLVAKNVYCPAFAPSMSARGIGIVARIAVVFVTVFALFLAAHSSTTLVGLLILAYSGVAQFAPGIILGMCSPKVGTAGVMSGLLVGLSVTGLLVFTGNDPFRGMNAGFVGLVPNVALVGAAALIFPSKRSGFDVSETRSAGAALSP